MQLVIGVDDMKPSRMTTLNDVTQQNILFIEKIKLIKNSLKYIQVRSSFV
jgi:hypothetical protein